MGVQALLGIDLSRAELRSRVKVRKLAPDRAELNRMFPGCEHVEKNERTGRSEWVIDVTTHERNGTMTRHGKKLASEMAPFMKAKTEQGRSLASRLPAPVALKDDSGIRRYVQPHLVDEAVRRNGWRSGESWRGGHRVERGSPDMLYRLIHGEWEPLGVTCLSRPFVGSSVNARGLQYDPDGHPWRVIEGAWRRVG
jgi:hypothetical protein